MKISVVIPSYDGSRNGNVARLKEQLAHQTLPPHEVIVVVGVSPNGRARNQGVEQTAGDCLVFIDDDVILGHDRVLAQLLQPFRERHDVGMTGPAQLIPENSAWWQNAAARQIPRNFFPVQTELVDSDMVSHMCLAIPTKLFRELGGENPDIIAGTDPDLRHRVRQAGLRVCVVPDCWAYHPLPATIGGLLRQAFAKGRNSAIVRRTHPEMILELDAGHRASFTPRRSLPCRILRLAEQLLLALATARIFLLLHLFAYAAGNMAGGMATLPRQHATGEPGTPTAHR